MFPGVYDPYGIGASPFFTFAIQNFPFIEKDFDALTDYQLMCKIFKYLDEEIKKVDAKYDGFGDKIEKLENDFVLFTQQVEQEINDFRTEILSSVDNKNEVLYNRVVDLMSQYQTVFKTYVDTQIQAVNHRIDEVEVGAINIYNPITGTVDPISVVINDLYNQLRYNAITCTEYDGLELTATTYDGYMITANNFDLDGKSILMGN